MKYIILFFLFLSFSFTTLKYDNNYNCNEIENFNKRIYSFNRGLDKTLFTPFSSIYLDVMPDFVSSSINNFFKNISEIQNMFFNLLIKDYNGIYINLNRFFINSIVGMFGFVDFAENFNLFYNFIDIRQVLGYYGFTKSNYIVLPFIGPSDFNFCLCLIIVQFINPCFYFFNRLLIYYFFEIINKRTYLNFDINFFHKTMFNGYLFLKDVYIQNSEFYYNHYNY